MKLLFLMAFTVGTFAAIGCGTADATPNLLQTIEAVVEKGSTTSPDPLQTIEAVVARTPTPTPTPTTRPTVQTSGTASGYVDGVGVKHDIMRTAIHVPENETVEYSTIPPTSGDHWNTPQACGFYEDGLPDERVTHNLEHGNIVISYNLLGEPQVDELKSAVDDIGLSNIWGVTRAYHKIEPGQVALAAWGVSDIMEGIDAGRIRTFFETYAGDVVGPQFCQ